MERHTAIYPLLALFMLFILLLFWQASEQRTARFAPGSKKIAP